MEKTEYKLTKSNRKTIALYIRQDGTLEIKAPISATVAFIEDFVKSKQEWILKNMEKAKSRNSQKKDFSIKAGDKILYLGKETQILKNNDNFVKFDVNNFYIPENIDFNLIKHSLIKIYKKLAGEFILKRVFHYSEIMKLSPSNIKINSAKTRWGSCSGKNNLNFSWKLIMASEKIIDYVVVHELAHIKEHNHSLKFWKLVENTLPDFKVRKNELKVLEKRLSVENWD